MQTDATSILSKPKGTQSHTFDTVLLYCFIGGVLFSKSYVLPGVSVADVSLVCVSLLILVRFFAAKVNAAPIQYQNIFFFFLFWLCAFLGGFYLMITSPSWFSNIEYVKSFTKLSFYGVVFFLFTTYFRRITRDRLHTVILFVVVINSFIAIYILAVLVFNLPLPYKFFWYGHLDAYSTNNLYRLSGMVVARGTLSEASVFGLVQNLGLAFLYFSPVSQVRMNKWLHMLVVISILFTISLSAYIVLALNLILHAFKNKFYGVLRVIGIVILITVLALLVPRFMFSVVTISKRINEVVIGTDHSANVRLKDSWDGPFKAINDSPIVGTGLGNLGQFVLLNLSSTRYTPMEGSEGFNIPAYILGSTGISGLIFFALLIANLIKLNVFGGMVFIATLFASNNFLDPSFWIFYILFILMFEGKERRNDLTYYPKKNAFR